MKVILVLVFLTLFRSVYSYSIDENKAGNLEKKKEDFQLNDEKLSFDDEDLNQGAEEESFDVIKMLTKMITMMIMMTMTLMIKG